MIVVFLNGPAGCGKDTIANLLCSRNQWAHRKFSTPLKNALSCLLPFTPDYLTQGGKNALVRPDGLTVRKALIELSEAYAKPIMGVGIFGRLLVVELQGVKEEVVVVSDSRFHEEAMEVARANVVELILFRVHRQKCVWAGDSGGYQYPVHFPSFDLDNNGTPLEACLEIERMVSEIM